MESNFYIEYYKRGQLVRQDAAGKGYAYCYSGFSWGDIWKIVQTSIIGYFSKNYVDALMKIAQGSDTTCFKKQTIDIVYDGSYDQIKIIFTGWSDDDLISDACGFDSQNIGAYWEWKFFTISDNKYYRVTWSIDLHALNDGAPKSFRFSGYAKDDGWWQDSLASSMLEINYRSLSYGYKSTLYTNEMLNADSVLMSENREYRLIMQRDGNLVIYDSGNRAVWASNTNGRGDGCRLVMQGDGNLVIYNPKNQPVWASGTAGKGNGCRLVMQNDRNLVIYNSQGAPVWASNTNL